MSELDKRIEEIEARLRALPVHAGALFSCSVCERLSDVYPAFVAKEGWGDKGLVRTTLDAAWRLHRGEESKDRLMALLREVERGTPYAEDFRSLESVIAQNLCISLDAAVRLCLGDTEIGPVSGEYGFEALRAAISNRETGYIDVGSGAAAEQFEKQLIKHPLISTELENQLFDLQRLENLQSPPNREAVMDLERRARANHVAISDLL